MKPPPLPFPPTLGRQFAADPFDPRMHRASPNREHTALGLLIEIWHWYETHQAECGPAFRPIAGSIREHLERECPNALRELGVEVQGAQPGDRPKANLPTPPHLRKPIPPVPGKG